METPQPARKRRKFNRQDIHKKKRLANTWRKPRGIDSKIRIMMINRVIPKPGYGNARSQRGKYRGMEVVVVNSLAQVKELDPKKHTAVVSGKLGLKKKLPIMKELIKHKISIHNFADHEKYISEKEGMLQEKKKLKKEAEKKKEEKKEKAGKKDNIDDKVKEDVSEEEKKKTEKKEIDKLLTQKV